MLISSHTFGLILSCNPNSLNFTIAYNQIIHQPGKQAALSLEDLFSGKKRERDSMKIVTDCAADLPAEELDSLGITQAPLYIHFPEGEVSALDLTPD
jgi:hypothetical protein